MAFLDDLTKKARDVAAVAADKAKDAAELTRITVAIAGEQRELEKSYRAIGEWFVNEYEGQIPDAVRDLVEAAVTSKAKIADLEAAKAAGKEDAEGAGEPAQDAPQDGERVCPNCGAKSDGKFCPQCGTPLDMV